MKKVVLIIFLLICLLVGGGAGYVLHMENKRIPKPEPAPDWKMFEVKAWDEAVYKLVPPPSEDGNAVSYFLKATYYDPKATDSFSSKMPYDWWSQISTVMLESDKAEDLVIKEKAIQIPEIDLLIKGSLQKNYQFFGVHYVPTPKPEQPYYMVNTPAYMDISKLIILLTFRAEHKLAVGDVSGAEFDLLAAIRASHILQKDATYIGFVIGLTREVSIAEKMPAFYRKIGDEAKAVEWEAFLKLETKRKDEIKPLWNFIQSNKMDDLAKVVANRSLPRAIRSESMLYVLINHVMYRPISTIFMGLPEDIGKFIAQEHFEDPELVIIQYKIIEDIYVGPLSTFNGRRHLFGEVQSL